MRISVAVAIACFSALSVSAAEEAHAAVRKHTSIAPQGLGPALQALAQDHGIQLVYRSDLVGDRQTAGAVGDLTLDEALTQLLKGSGITFQYLGNDAITLVPSSPRSYTPVVRSTAYGALLAAAEVPVGQATEASGGAQATNGTQPVVALEEVVVTARKRNEEVIDIPSTVVAFGRDQLQSLHADTLADLQPSIPNFFFSTNRPIETNVTMRGLGAGLGLVAPGVGMYIDGAYQTSAASFLLPLFDLERVEVLKGPQGTLYGRNSLAGALNYITRAPSDQLQGDLTAEYGNGDTRKGSVSISGPIVGDVLTARISAGAQRRTGFYKFSSDGSDADPDDYDAVSGRIRLKPSDNFSADLTYAYQDLHATNMLLRPVVDINDTGEKILHPSHFQAGALAGHQADVGNFTHHGGTLNLTYSAGAFDITSITTYDKQENDTYYYIGAGAVDIAHARSNYAGDSVSEELRAQSTGNGPFHWLVGAYYTKGKNNTDDCCGSLLGGLAFGPGFMVPLYEDKFHGYAGFTDLEYEINTKWVVGAGFRYDSVDKEQVNPFAPTGVQKETFSAEQPKATLRYRLFEDGQLYLSAAKGFREGGFNYFLYGTPNASYDNDLAWSYEAGWKTAFDDRRGYLGLAAFYIDASNFTSIASLPFGAISTLAPINVGKVRSYGAELELNYRFTDRFSTQFASGYNKATPTELVASIAPGVAAVDEQVLYAPLWNFRAAGTFAQPVGADRTLNLTAAYSGTGPTNFQGSQITGKLAERDPFYLLDLIASFDWAGKYTLSAFVKNATDEKYSTGFYDQTACAAFGCQEDSAIYANPRYYGMSFSAKWR
jgi:iron complex outermembrane receptor protein